MSFLHSSLRLCLGAALVTACSSQSQHASELDGPIKYSHGSGFFGYSAVLRVELSGAAVRTVTTSPAPGEPGELSTETTTATLAPGVIAQLHGDVAAVDLASFREAYTCELPRCNNADRGGASLEIAADGTIFHISIDAGIEPKDLPPGLVKLRDDLDAVESSLPE